MRRWKRDLLARVDYLEQRLATPIAVGDHDPIGRGIARVVVTADPLAYVDKATTVRVTVEGDGSQPSGSVTLYANNRALTGTTKELIYGSATWALTYAKSGHHGLTAKYGGDSHYEAQTISNLVDLEVR